MEMKITNSEKETFDLGNGFAKTLKRGSIVALNGELGAGKTVFVKGIAKGLGIIDHILSPTFTLLRQYDGLNHFDVYRIKDSEELYEIGFLDYLYGDEITIIEWANLIEDILPSDVIHVDILRANTENKRIIKIESNEEKK